MSMDANDWAYAARHDCTAEIATLVQIASHGPAGIADRMSHVNPAVLLDVARLNKVLYLLWQVRPVLRRVTPAILPALDKFRLRTIAINRRCLGDAARLAGAFQEAGISHVHFKGPLQQLALYGDPLLKPTADIDILVRPGDRARAAALLGGRGYRAQEAEMTSWWTRHLGEEHYSPAEGGPVVDLHHRLQQPGSPGLSAEERFIEDAVSFTVEGQMVPVPSPPHVCLVIAANLAKEVIAREPCLSHAIDMHAALLRLSPSEAEGLAQLARVHGMSETLAFAMHAVEMFFSADTDRRQAVGANPLGHVPEATLTAMIAQPWDVGIDWPRRRSILWAFCGGAPLRFLAEARRALGSELHRRVLELPARKFPRRRGRA